MKNTALENRKTYNWGNSSSNNELCVLLFIPLNTEEMCLY